MSGKVPFSGGGSMSEAIGFASMAMGRKASAMVKSFMVLRSDTYG
jgi:hypothetical protein